MKFDKTNYKSTAGSGIASTLRNEDGRSEYPLIATDDIAYDDNTRLDEHLESINKSIKEIGEKANSVTVSKDSIIKELYGGDSDQSFDAFVETFKKLTAVLILTDVSTSSATVLNSFLMLNGKNYGHQLPIHYDAWNEIYEADEGPSSDLTYSIPYVISKLDFKFMVINKKSKSDDFYTNTTNVRILHPEIEISIHDDDAYKITLKAPYHLNSTSSIEVIFDFIIYKAGTVHSYTTKTGYNGVYPYLRHGQNETINGTLTADRFYEKE